MLDSSCIRSPVEGGAGVGVCLTDTQVECAESANSFIAKFGQKCASS